MEKGRTEHRMTWGNRRERNKKELQEQSCIFYIVTGNITNHTKNNSSVKLQIPKKQLISGNKSLHFTTKTCTTR